MNVNLEVDEQSDAVVTITIVLGEGGLQLQPFAAPRSGGFWEEVRAELGQGITTAGGAIDGLKVSSASRSKQLSQPSMKRASTHSRTFSSLA